MFLTDEERRILDGALGEPQRLALGVLVKLGEVCGAKRMVEIASAHLVASSYQIAGEAGIEIYSRLVEQGAKVRVRTTSDPGSVDFARWREFKTPEQYAARQVKIAELLGRMGVIPTWTCTPYTTFNVPRFGEHLGWSESSAVVFANSVIGARTNRLAAYVDLCAALTGRVPCFGLHLDAGRRGEVLFELDTDLSEHFADHFFPVLGYLVGQRVQDRIPVITGVRRATADQLKAFGAASAASGSVALYHMVGITPEARTLDEAFAGRVPEERIRVGRRDLQTVVEQMGATDGPVDVVGVGCPHASLDQIRRYATLLEGKRVHPDTRLWICTNVVVEEMARKMGYVDIIERAGAALMVGTCHNDSPLEAWRFRRLATDSGKFAYYTPTTVGTECVFASTEACIEAAITGKVERGFCAGAQKPKLKGSKEPLRGSLGVNIDPPSKAATPRVTHDGVRSESRGSLSTTDSLDAIGWNPRAGYSLPLEFGSCAPGAQKPGGTPMSSEQFHFQGHGCAAGEFEGEVVVSSQPFGFWQGMDPQTGVVIDKRHDAYGLLVKGKAFVFPFGRGSTGTPGIFLEAVRNGCAPGAIVNVKSEPMIIMCALLAEAFFKVSIPIVDGLNVDPSTVLRTGDRVRISGTTGLVEVIRT